MGMGGEYGRGKSSMAKAIVVIQFKMEDACV